MSVCPSRFAVLLIVTILINRVEPYSGDMIGLLINAFDLILWLIGIVNISVQTFAAYRGNTAPIINLLTQLQSTSFSAYYAYQQLAYKISTTCL